MPNDKKDWYALGKEAEEEEAKAPGATKAKVKNIVSSRSEWYQAAGEEVPQEPAPKAPLKGKAKRAAPPEAIDPNQESELLQVSAGRKDPPWGLIGTVAVGLLVVAVVAFLVTRKPEVVAEPEVDLPIKNVQTNKSYGFVVDPPTGFRQQGQAEPDLFKGVHGELHVMVNFTNAAAGVSAYYFGEMRKDTTLDQYVAIGTQLEGKVSAKPLDVIPDGMKAFPTKGFLIETGDAEVLYYASQDKDIFVSVYSMAPKAAFTAQSETVQAAVRALKVVVPTGPHPDKTFAAQDPAE